MPRSVVSDPADETDEGSLVARVLGGIDEIDAATWDACAGDVDPFLSHAFLLALEESGSVTAETGWAPRHVVVESDAGEVVGVAPAYLKGHSYGEYVFDHSWAAAFERVGGDYYPKLQVAVPFTPVTGRRLLVRPGPGSEARERAVIAALTQITDRLGLSSLHVTFATEAEWRRMGDAGLLLRTGEQFHWENRGYGSFDDFLADLSSRKRKTIRKERQTAQSEELSFETLTGDSLSTAHWDAFFHFYMDTGGRKWGTPYLNRAFFDLLGERLADKVVLMMVKRNGRYIAGALNFRGKEALYGRYWGCIEDHDCLHFETCYYRAIDYAIEHGLPRVEAGAQGPHKIQRGYLPTLTYSAHWIRDEGFRRAVAQYLDQERDHVALETEALREEYSPFKRG
ncbi:MAG: GNAT family N-acetyltransferase [Rhodospirillaceae bacterium]|nr:GNAT family N-acetyltransferase [Rhodospirillaceae bacterium]